MQADGIGGGRLALRVEGVWTHPVQRNHQIQWLRRRIKLQTLCYDRRRLPARIRAELPGDRGAGAYEPPGLPCEGARSTRLSVIRTAEWGMVKLSPGQQQNYLDAAPDVFEPAERGHGDGAARPWSGSRRRKKAIVTKAMETASRRRPQRERRGRVESACKGQHKWGARVRGDAASRARSAPRGTIWNARADLPEARPFDRASADMLYHGQDVSSAGGCFPARHSAWQFGGRQRRRRGEVGLSSVGRCWHIRRFDPRLSEHSILTGHCLTAGLPQSQSGRHGHRARTGERPSGR